MKTKLSLIIVTILISLNIVAQTWSTLPNFPGTTRNRACSFSIGAVNKSYIMGGYSGGAMQNDFWEYNHVTNVWTQLPNFPGVGRSSAVAFSVNGKGYIATGVNWGFTWYNDFWEFNPTGNAWTQLPNVPGSVRGYATGFGANGKAYVGMGVNGGGPNLNPLNDFYEFNFGTMTWSAIANFPGTGRYSPVAFTIGNNGYVGTGVTIPSPGVYSSTNDFYQYNTTTGVWNPIANYPGVVGEGVGYSFCNMGVVGTGYTNPPHTTYLNTFYAYRAQTNSWTALPNSPGAARAYAVGFVNQNKLFLLTGANAGGGVLYNDFHQLNFTLKSTVNVSDSTICLGTPVNFTSIQNPIGNASSFSWTLAGATPSLANTQNVNGVSYPAIGIYNVFFVSSNICVKDSIAKLAYIQVSPNPIISAIANPTSLCLGQSATLTASGAGINATYTWTSPSLLANVSNTIITPSITENYTASATSSAGCTGSAAVNVVVVVTSPVTVNTPNNICEGATANLTANSNPIALAYVWSGPNNFSATGTSASITNILPNATGVYNVTATWVVGNKSCTISGNNQINVVAVSPITINPTLAVCNPANVQLSSSSAGAITYSWLASNGFTSNIPNPLMASPSTTASGIYSVTTAYTNGVLTCYNTATTQVIVNPVLPFSLIPFKQICFSSLYTVNGPVGATNYLWAGPNGFTSNTQNLNLPAAQANNTGDYTLTVSLGSCTTFATTKVEVLSPISFTLTPGNKTICAGDSVKLIIGSAGGSRNYAYMWNPQQWLASPTGSAQYAHPNSTTIYNIMGYDITCPHYTISTSFTLNVNRAPLPNLELEKTEGCEPLCLLYNSKTQNDAALITYDFGNGVLMQNDNFSYCLSEPGTYNLKIKTTGKNGCSAIYNHSPINVWPTPHSDFSYTPDEPTSSNNHVTFEPTSQYDNVAKHLWYFAGAGSKGNDVSDLKNPSRIYDNVGKYPVVLISISDKGCSDTVLKVIDMKDEFVMYIPNSFTPNGDGLNDVFAVKGSGIKVDGFEMNIFNRWGTLIYSTKDVLKGWDGIFKDVLSENGIYIYKIHTSGANGEGRKEYVGQVNLMK